MADSLIEKWIY